MDAATGAMNRILKNVMDSPKQDLFVKVLENLPPTRDMTDAESIDKTCTPIVASSSRVSCSP